VRRRDEDARPPIEVLGAEPEITSTRHVAVGASGGTLRRGRALAAALAVVAVLGGGLVLGDGNGDAGTAEPEERDNEDRTHLDKPQTSTTGRRTTTTRPPTTTTAPQGPPLGDPIDGALVLVEGGTWTVVELINGRQHEVNVPRGAAYELAVVAGGVVVPAGGQALYYRLLPAPPASETVDLGPADQVFAAADDEQVWLIDGLHEPGQNGAGTVDVRLVDLTGRVLRSFDVPGRSVSAITGDTLLLSRGGRIYATEGGGLRPVATGLLAGTLPGAAVVLSCDAVASCGLWRVPLDGAPSRLLREVEDPDSTYFDWSASPEGRLVIAQYSELTLDQVLLLFDPSGRSLGTVPPPPSDYGSMPAWLPGDLGLVLPSGSGLAAIRLSGGDPVVDYLSFGPASPEVVYALGL
jgi:hypothetical protein